MEALAIFSAIETAAIIIAVAALLISHKKKQQRQTPGPGSPSRMRLVYLCHQYAGNPKANEKHCLQILKEVKRVFPDVAMIAPQVYLPQYYDDDTERAQVMKTCLALLEGCQEMWVELTQTKISTGMREELTYCRENGITVRFFVLTKDALGLIFIEGPKNGNGEAKR